MRWCDPVGRLRLSEPVQTLETESPFPKYSHAIGLSSASPSGYVQRREVMRSFCLPLALMLIATSFTFAEPPAAAPAERLNKKIDGVTLPGADGKPAALQ